MVLGFSGGKLTKELMRESLDAAFIEQISKYLYLDGSEYDQFWIAMTTAYNFIKIVGFALLVTFFLKALLQEATKDNLTIEQLVKLMIGLILSVTIINNIPTITNAFLKISETGAAYVLDNASFRQDANNGYGGIDDNTVGIFNWFGTPNGTGVIDDAVNAWKANTPNPGAFLQACIFWLVHQICVIAFDFAIISRALDIGWRVVIAPISCANMFEGANSPGVKHLKSIFGSALVALLLAIIARAGTYLMVGFLVSTEDGSTFMALATQVAMAGLAVGATNKAKEIL